MFELIFEYLLIAINISNLKKRYSKKIELIFNVPLLPPFIPKSWKKIIESILRAFFGFHCSSFEIEWEFHLVFNFSHWTYAEELLLTERSSIDCQTAYSNSICLTRWVLCENSEFSQKISNIFHSNNIIRKIINWVYKSWNMKKKLIKFKWPIDNIPSDSQLYIT